MSKKYIIDQVTGSIGHQESKEKTFWLVYNSEYIGSPTVTLQTFVTCISFNEKLTTDYDIESFEVKEKKKQKKRKRENKYTYMYLM